MSEIIIYSGEKARDLSTEKTIALTWALDNASNPPPRVPVRHAYKRSPKVANVSASFKLHKQRRSMTAHVVKDLVLQSRKIPPVVMIRHRAGLIPADSAVREHAMPEFGITGTACCADIQALIKKPGKFKNLTSERHACTGANLPDPATARVIRGEKGVSEIPATVPAAKSPICFEMPLRCGLEFCRQDQSGNRHDVRRIESIREPFQPTRMQDNVVIGVGDNVSPCRTGACVACNIEPGPIFPDVFGICRIDDFARSLVGRSVVDDDYLGWAQSLPTKRCQASRKRIRPVARANHDTGLDRLSPAFRRFLFNN